MTPTHVAARALQKYLALYLFGRKTFVAEGVVKDAFCDQLNCPPLPEY
jgi:hypothetical protein